MKLFNDKELFATGTRGTREFDLPDADVMLIDNFFNKEESDSFWEHAIPKTTKDVLPRINLTFRRVIR
mgnify:CR=1 FL=1